MIFITNSDNVVMPVDAALTEEHTLDSAVTDYPVESGGDITDNVRPEPREVRLECLISDTPSADVDTARRTHGQSNDVTDAIAENGIVQFHSQAFAFFEAIRDKREPVTITTSLRSYTNMVMKRLSVPRAVDNSDALSFTVTFRQITIKTNQRTRIRTATPSTGARNDKGKVAPGAIDPSIPYYQAVSFPTPGRAAFIKTFGKPLVTDAVPPNGQPVGTNGQWDHYAGQYPNVDGWVQSGVYHPYNGTRQGGAGIAAGGAEPGQFVNGRPVHFDPAQNAWVDDQHGNVVRGISRKQNGASDPAFEKEKWNDVHLNDYPPPSSATDTNEAKALDSLTNGL